MSKRNDQVPEIYKEAIKKYEEITKKKLDDPALLKLTCVDDLINEIEQRDDKFSEFREKNHSFFTVLEGVMRPIEHIGPVAAGAASMAFSPSSLVFGAVSHLINAANGVSASYNAIQDLMESLKVREQTRYPGWEVQLANKATEFYGSAAHLQQRADFRRTE